MKWSELALCIDHDPWHDRPASDAPSTLSFSFPFGLGAQNRGTHPSQLVSNCSFEINACCLKLNKWKKKLHEENKFSKSSEGIMNRVAETEKQRAYRAL